MATLVLEKLNLWYGKHTHAVRDVDLVVEDGELCVFLGPSGCGKTSTLRMIAGFVKPTSGKIYLDGEVINDLYPGDRNVAMIFQSYALYPHLTVREQLAFPLRAKRVPRQEIAKRVEEIAHFLHLEDFLDRYPQELSAGQRQRVAIGRALIRKPKLFLMDEPLSQLDARLRVEMRANLRKLQQELRITTIYVTHDQTEAQGLADKIMVMHQGRVQQVGKPIEIYENPENLFVAGFVGMPAMNFLRGVLSRGKGVEFRGNGISIALSSGLGERVAPLEGREVILGVRPEHLVLARGQGENVIRGEIYVVEPQSNEYIVDVRVGGETVKVRLDKRECASPPRPGEVVEVAFEDRFLYLFDPVTEKRLL
ncbi:MAG: ABC transporter ATP-binding protein [Candidatus Caldatribacterium sp.]|uniref:ABC transporter ATP-binding protein n=1 Tax=Candidatus Caldatribacterium sp. TaxID=2282143 RepID=UPI00299A0E7D|nr:ABC transporter ATP-binding protein [Candidatus Caldatribacterium sp.]MCX7731190.1 ABC transporter ATP-binding protein [Candidatus Caldatribacterium sp.]MDW8080343.1 ABC transporter ATP-binding protein [Candidatus Calescibacterium sp.]